MQKYQYFRNEVKKFYAQNRRNFFWRNKKLTLFQVMLVELFLKKTRAETVDSKMLDFIIAYPNNKKLLKENKRKLLKQISVLGLGNQRATALKKISEYIHKQYNDKLPADINKIMNIPYIGLYTANAIMCFGFDKRSPILDVNISRIVSRVFGVDNTRDLRDNVVLQGIVSDILPRKNFKEYNWGLLDMGALICKPKPQCLKCPLKRKCDYYVKKRV